MQNINAVFEKRYQNLNKEQREAVDTTEGPVLVIAGPGSGKTELLSLRVGNILKLGLASPSNILCLTFTENGAINMRERLVKLIGQNAYRVNIFTFHAFCNSVIGRFPEYFYNATNFSQASDIARAEIITNIFKDLPHKHPFASFHPELGFAYLKDVTDRIKHIKSGGYTPEEYKQIVLALKKDYAPINEALTNWPEGRITIKRIDEFNKIVNELENLSSTTSKFLVTSFKNALDEASAMGTTSPIGDWKKKYLATEETTPILKESYNYEKILALAEIYELYTNKMHEHGLYDYDDMIIEVAHNLKNNSILRNELEEQYQYILLDEFQDTNEAQMNLVRAITSNPVHEGKPNIMVVGDDDQAIYKFQGAEVSHIMNFRENTYREVKTIVLDKNYRSTADILSLARNVIKQGKVRLENRFEDITKELKSENKNLPESDISITKYESDIEEYMSVAIRIKEALDGGESANEIAVLARGHKELKNLLPYLDQQNIPYEYIKKANVFDEGHIKELITVCDYLSSVLNPGNNKDYLLPEILSYKFWNLERVDIFNVAVTAKTSHISWMEALKKNNNARLQEIYEILTNLSVESQTLPLENLLDTFMSQSGFKEYYFSKNSLKERPTTYVYFLASLKTFIESLREWKSGTAIFARDVAFFVETHKANNIPLVSESVFTKSANAVQLMTAHASKGLEFNRVFVINAHDKLWTKGGMTNKAPFPSALSQLLTPAGENEDDFIRLFFVAITRAKHSLHITAHNDVIRFLPQELITHSKLSTEQTNINNEAHENALGLVNTPFKEDEWALLSKLVEGYKMPVTHLNNFLDIKNGGPMHFVSQNLLRFPQPMNASGAYGDAIHKSIEEIILHPQYNGGEKPTLEHIIAKFNFVLSKARLPQSEDKYMRERGHKTLTKYFEEKINTFKTDDKIEVDMKDEGVSVGEAQIIGKLDFLRKENNEYEVLDFKTGESFSDWEGEDENDKIKLHKYRQQLIVYKLLLEKSKNYKLPVKKLALQFVEENKKGEITELALDVNEEEIERTEKLIDIVYRKIVNLDFPDISKYENNYKGITAFENDLIEEKI